MSAESMTFARSVVSGLKAQSKGQKVEEIKPNAQKIEGMPKMIVLPAMLVWVRQRWEKLF